MNAKCLPLTNIPMNQGQESTLKLLGKVVALEKGKAGPQVDHLVDPLLDLMKMTE